MDLRHLLATAALCTFFAACSDNTLEEKGFQVGPTEEEGATSAPIGLNMDPTTFATRPSAVLLTGAQHIRLTTVYKVNLNKKDSSTFIGSNHFHYDYEGERTHLNNWNGHMMPGIEAVYGYNLVNVSHYDVRTDRSRYLYDRPVLIKTLYYPSSSIDTLNGAPVTRAHFLVTVYDEDTNKDGFVNTRDLRRMHLFDVNGIRMNDPIPANYSVFGSTYDPANDRMHIFAKLDTDHNGVVEELEPVHIHWIDLKDPARSGRLY